MRDTDKKREGAAADRIRCYQLEWLNVRRQLVVKKKKTKRRNTSNNNWDRWIDERTSCLAWANDWPSIRVMEKRKELMAMGSYAVCSVIALQRDDLISVRGHMTPASLIQKYIVGPIKKKPNKLNLRKKRTKSDANYLWTLSLLGAHLRHFIQS